LAFTGCGNNGGDDVSDTLVEDDDDTSAESDDDADDDGPAASETDAGTRDDVTFGPAAPSVDVMEPDAPAPTEPAALPDDYIGPTEDSPLVACETAVGTGDATLIDDFEDLDDLTSALDGRDGGWYAYNDLSAGGAQVLEWIEVDDGATDGTGVLHITGSGLAEYSGIGAGLRWTESGDEFCYYDASYYEGITFWARGNSPIRVAFQTPAVRPVAEGGTCATTSCYDAHGYNVSLSSVWTRYRIAFDAISQAGWGTNVGPFHPEELFTIEFQFNPGANYDIQIDDLAFYRDEMELPEPGVDAGLPDADAGTDDPTDPLDAGAPGDASL
jgi:hypothetical protein